MTRTRILRVTNPNGTVKTYRGEEAEILTPEEATMFRRRLLAMGGSDLLACLVDASETLVPDADQHPPTLAHVRLCVECRRNAEAVAEHDRR